MPRLLRILAVSLLVTGYVPAVTAYSAVVSVHRLLNESQLVVLAEVVSVVESGEGAQRQHVATARVLEFWKGRTAAKQLEFIASPGWFACDTSTAHAGETVILFLSQAPGESRPRIAHFGRGRLPVSTIDGAKVAFIYELRFPPSVPVRRHAGHSGGESVGVASLKSFVQELTPGPP